MGKNILVLGATGKTGKRVSERLTTLNIPYRSGSRNASPAFDWENSLTWADALAGIKKVYITFQPDLAIPKAAGIIQSFVELCKKSNVQKLVLLSGRGEKEAQVCENIVIDSGLDWTVVRAAWFMQNFSESIFLDPILASHMVLPKVSALEPFMDVEDIADVVIEALTNDVHSKKIYELTGPELVSFEKATAIISTAINRTIIFQEVEMEEYISLLRSYQLPEDAIGLIKYLFTEVLDGRNAFLTDDVRRVLGREPANFSEFARRTVATGVWG